MVDWASTVTPDRASSNARASYNRFIEKGYGRANDGFDMTSLGISKSLLAQLPSPQSISAVWNFDNGYQTLGRSQSNNYTNTYELQGSVTKVAGSHTIKAGIDVRQINYELQNTGDILSFTGDTTLDAATPYINGESTRAIGYATFLLGIVERIFQLSAVPLVEAALYGVLTSRTTGRSSRRLTLNLGLR